VLSPGAVRDIMLRTARNHPCPAGGVEDYTDEGFPERNATCAGTVANNGIYGEGIVNAEAAGRRR
jgi:lantibiotic leader peptide-processing serine protease